MFSGVCNRLCATYWRRFTRTPLPQASVYLMLGGRAGAAGIAPKLGNHSAERRDHGGPPVALAHQSSEARASSTVSILSVSPTIVGTAPCRCSVACSPRGWTLACYRDPRPACRLGPVIKRASHKRNFATTVKRI